MHSRTYIISYEMLEIAGNNMWEKLIMVNNDFFEYWEYTSEYTFSSHITDEKIKQ